MTAELLRAEDLRLEREGVGRLDHMDFTVTAGDSIGVVGLSGGGKTALAEVLCGEREPDQGRVWYEGRPAGRELLSRLGFRIRGDSALVRNLSVAENLLILGRPVGERRLFCRERPLVRLCREFLRDFGLEAWTDAPPAEIPPAVQHRLLLVSALMRKKRLIALDHVADVYTAQEQALLADCIQSVCERGAAALYLSGQIDRVLWRLDRVTVVRDGRRVKELRRGGFSEAALGTYIYGYHSSRPLERGGGEGGQVAFTLDGIPIRANRVTPILDGGGGTGGFVRRLRPFPKAAVLPARALSDRWISSMSVMDNLLLPVSRRLGGPLGHVGGSIRRVLRMECMEQTGLRPHQMEEPFARLTRMERFRLLLYRERLNAPVLWVLDHITAGADFQDREAMRRLAGTLPGVVLYISGDYRELEAFETRILSLEGECLREERA